MKRAMTLVMVLLAGWFAVGCVDAGSDDAAWYPGLLAGDSVSGNPAAGSAKIVGVPAVEVRVTSDADDSIAPVAAWTGSEYGVAWESGDDDGCNVYFARVSAGGSVIASPARLSNGPKCSMAPSIAFAGEGFGVAWEDWRDGNAEIYFVKVMSNGVTAGPERRVTWSAGGSENADLLYTGSEFGLAWSDGRDGKSRIYFARLDNGGAMVGGEVMVTGGDADCFNPEPAWTGSEFGVAWQDRRVSPSEIFFARLSATGVKIGGDVMVTNTGGNAINPSLAWNGSGWGMTWSEQGDGGQAVYFAGLEADGSMAGSGMMVSAPGSTASYSKLAWTGAGYAAVWGEYWYGSSYAEIYYAAMDADGFKTGADVPVTGSAVMDEPDAVWNGAGIAMGWSDRRDGNSEIYFRTMTVE